VILAEELHVDAGLVELAGDEEMQGMVCNNYALCMLLIMYYL